MSAKPKFEFDAMMTMMSVMINGSMFQCFKVNVIYFSTEVTVPCECIQSFKSTRNFVWESE